MKFKRFFAMVTAITLLGRIFTVLPASNVFSAEDEYLCRDYHSYGVSQNYMTLYNTATSEHFQIFWGNDDQTGLVNDNFIRINLEYLEKYRDVFVNDLGMDEGATSIYNPDGNKYKTNVYLTRTGLPDFQEGWAYMGSEAFTGFAFLLCEPAALVQENGSSSEALPHEYGHVLTYHMKAWVDQSITGPWWEGLANWFREQYFQSLENPKTEFFLPYLRNMNLTIPYGRMYYESWIFLQYLTDNPDNYPNFGEKFIGRVISEAEPNEYPFDTIERLSGNDMKDVMGNFAKRMATLDFVRKDVFNQSLQQVLNDPYVWQLIYTQLEDAPDKENCYIVPAEKAPMQTGLNVIPLNIEGNEVSVTLRGLSDAEGADWRACIVAEGADGVTRYSPLFGEGTQTYTLDGTETALYLTVAATPDEIVPNSAFDKAENGDQYSYTKGDYKRRYPYEVEITGASPMRRDIKTQVAGHYHSNGGGFVENSANVADTVYVGKDAMVLGTSTVTGNVVITDHAVVSNAQISDNAKISGNACVYGNWWNSAVTVRDNAKVGENAVVTGDVVISGNARVMGNAYLMDSYQVTDNATVKGTAYCYGSGIASDQAILDGEFYNDQSVSHGAAFGWLESENYNSNLPYTDGLYVGYEFSRQSSAYAYDTYGATDGILRNTPVWEASRTSADGVLTFNGKNQYIICDDTLADYKDMEISTAILWRGGDNEQKVFDFGGGEHMYFTPSNYEGKAQFVIGNTTLTAESALEKGKWYVVRVIIKDGKASLLLNGETVAQGELYTLPEDTISESSANYVARGQNGDYFNGSMDYFRVYYKEVSEPEYYYTETETITESIIGDVNADKKFDDADLVMMQQFLLGAGTLTDWQAGDLCEDGLIDVFDVCLMRKELVN